MSIFDAVQAQMNKERQNHATYAAFSVALEAENWPGFAAWMEAAAADEWTHYKKFRDFLIDRNQTPVLVALEAPPLLDGNNPVPFFQTALDLERANTASILALEDYDDEAEGTAEDPEADILCDFLYSWAISEQRKSERELVDAVLELSRVENDPAGLLALDHEYGEKAGA